MSSNTIPELRMKLYIDFLQSLALEDPSLSDVMENLTMAEVLATCSISSNQDPAEGTLDDLRSNSSTYGAFQGSELLAFGTRERYHLDSSTRKQLLEEVQNTLRSISDFVEGKPNLEGDKDVPPGLPGIIQAHKDEIEKKRQQITLGCSRVKVLLLQVTEMREALHHETTQAMATTLPVHGAVQSASNDLLAATIEMSLVKLSLTRARAERVIYTHSSTFSESKEENNVAKAITIAYSALKNDEKEMGIETHSLDQQLQEYESLLRLVDGGKGGYQQVVNDWTKVKQETDECLKDLRRLGWTGD